MAFCIKQRLCVWNATSHRVRIQEDHVSRHRMIDGNAPAEGCVTLNADASSASNDYAVYGIIIRDSEAQILLANAGPLAQGIAIVLGEVLAVLEEFRDARLHGWSKITVIADSLVTIQKIKRLPNLHSPYAYIVEECVSLSLSFNVFSFEFVRRRAIALLTY